MKNVKLAKNFWLKETTWSDTANQFVEPDQVQIELHRCIAETVQTLYRDRLGSAVRINRGQQNRSVYLALVAAGYHPSPRSDHNFGTEINGWRWSCGALDISFPGKEDETVDIYASAYDYLKQHPELESRIGQMILYPEMKMIHIANSYEVAYSKRLAEHIKSIRQNRKRYLISEGGSYRHYVK